MLSEGTITKSCSLISPTKPLAPLPAVSHTRLDSLFSFCFCHANLKLELVLPPLSNPGCCRDGRAAGLGVSSKAFLGWTHLCWLKLFVKHSCTSKVLQAWTLDS